MTRQDRTENPSQEGRGVQAAWWRLRLFTPGWREDQHPELNETLPGGWYGLDLVALGCAALVVGMGLRVCSLSPSAGHEPPRDSIVVGARTTTQPPAHLQAALASPGANRP